MLLKTSNDCASPAQKGSLLLSLPLVIDGKFVLISKLNLPCFQLNPLLLIPLSVDIKATDFHPLYIIFEGCYPASSRPIHLFFTRLKNPRLFQPLLTGQVL